MLSSGNVKITEIGFTCVSMTMPPASPGVT